MLCGKLGNQALLLLHTFSEFLRRIDIRIVIKDGDFKIPGQIFQHVAAAGRAAAVEQKTGTRP